MLVGDSYRAVSSIAVATRQLKGLVLSGGFARSPIISPLLKMLAALAPFFPGPFYRRLTLSFQDCDGSANACPPARPLAYHRTRFPNRYPGLQIDLRDGIRSDSV
ncbi:hypothetical protein [Paraburkholderia sp. BR14320]|uniref:hypothetical protein n=1 Tax=unclassified Paraburkholderia TaxID=2615204 RepID=UPI0034CD501F